MTTYRVFLDAKPYEIRSQLPTMLIAEMLPQLGEDGSRHIFLKQKDGERIYLLHQNSVDLRNEPWLYIDLPATGGGASR